MRVGVLQFPGSNCDQDAIWSLRDDLGYQAEYVWHESDSLEGFDAAFIPGGFTYGDYLRTGAIAARSPIMGALKEFAKAGRPVIGACNGFQILCEAGLLPGALLRNDLLQYRCRWVHIRTERCDTPFTRTVPPGQVLKIPISHGEGRYYASPETLARLRSNGQIVFRYSTPDGQITDEANPNGSLENIAGICNEGRNVLGLMPHPERASEALLGSEDGRLLFEGLLEGAVRR